MKNNEKMEEQVSERSWITADQEIWIKARILTAMRMALSLRAEKRVQADEYPYLYGFDGIAEGATVEIIHTLGLRSEYTNLRDYRNILSGKNTNLSK